MASVYAGVPTWREAGLDLVAGPWRGVIGPAGLTPEAIAFWEGALRAATASAAWRDELERRHWSDTFLTGEALRGFLHDEDATMTAELRTLGLARENPPD
jgi:putative tricarboxylic transport membrane protein